jgi:hypothetical protein
MNAVHTASIVSVERVNLAAPWDERWYTMVGVRCGNGDVRFYERHNARLLKAFGLRFAAQVDRLIDKAEQDKRSADNFYGF